jgi:hypothetical protein
MFGSGVGVQGGSNGGVARTAGQHGIEAVQETFPLLLQRTRSILY